MMAYISLFKMDYPVYAELVLKNLNEIVKCEVPNSSSLLNKIFKFKESTAFNEEFDITDIF